MDNRKPCFDVVIAGHFAKDRNVYLGEARPMLGGAVYYGGFVLAGLGVRGALLTRMAEKDRSLLQPLEDKGIRVFSSYGSATTGIENTYLDATRDRRTCKPIAVCEPLQAGAFPPFEASVVHIAPLICGEAPEPFVREVAQHGMLSLDAQGFLRVIHDGGLRLEKQEALSNLLPAASFFKLDHAEAEVLTDTDDKKAALEKIQAMGVREIVLTHAEGVTACRDNRYVQAAWTSRRLDGRTGRGDTCMAAYLGCRALGLSPEDSLPIAAVVTSLKMEQEGPFSVPLEQLPPEITAPLMEKLKEREQGKKNHNH